MSGSIATGIVFFLTNWA